MSMSVDIIKVVSKEHINIIRELFQEYADSLGFSLDFQNFDKELNSLPGDYAAPEGCLLLAYTGNQVVGCVGLRKISEGICEMKRMYLREEYRGKGIGKKLANRIIQEARQIGYKRMRLDTISTMVEAIHLYKSMGFKEIEQYYYNPIEGTKYMELKLRNENCHGEFFGRFLKED